MMKILTSLALVLVFQNAVAEDLESLLSGGPQTQQTRNSSNLADVMRGVLRTPTPEQNFFLRLVEESKWSEALYQFKGAFGHSSFAESEDGQALKSLLMYRSGLAVHGLEKLFQISDPKKIHFQLLSQWREVAPPESPHWSVARVAWKSEWTDIFGVATEVRVRSANLSLMQDPKVINELSMIAPADSRERALLDWNLALQWAVKDETKKAAVIVNSLMKAKNSPVGQDLVTLTAARLLYQNAYYEAAEKYYDKVPKSSDYYLEAQEEKAWSFLRRRQPQDALAISQTLVSPVFSGQVGPESWFVRSLAQLKICDYASALKTLQSFPKEFKSKAVALEALSKNADTPEVQKALGKLRSNQLTLASMSQISKNLPRSMVKDQVLRQLVRTQVVLESELAAVNGLTKNMKDVSTQAEFENYKNSTSLRESQAKANTLERIKKLSEGEVQEIKSILSKLHIVEAEIIQQVDSATKLTKSPVGQLENKKGSTGSHAEDVLRFPFQEEFWFDELTNYKVDIKKACQAKRTM